MNMRYSMLLLCTLCAISFEAYPQKPKACVKPASQQISIKQGVEKCKKQYESLVQEHQELTTYIEAIFSEIASQQKRFKLLFQTKFSEQYSAASSNRFSALAELYQFKKQLDNTEALLIKLFKCLLEGTDSTNEKSTTQATCKEQFKSADLLLNTIKTSIYTVFLRLYQTEEIPQKIKDLIEAASANLLPLISTLTSEEITKLTKFLTSSIINKLINNPDIIINALRETLSSKGKANIDKFLETLKQEAVDTN